MALAFFGISQDFLWSRLILKRTRISTVVLLCLVLSLDYSLGSLRVRFDATSIVSHQESYLTDADENTCASFDLSLGLQVPLRTKFRIGLSERFLGCLNVTLAGTRMNCDGKVFMSPLSAAQATKWTGRWNSCNLRAKTLSDQLERCLYQCPCRRFCEELQIIRMPSSVADSRWTLCEVSLARIKHISRCSEAPCSGIYSLSMGPSGNAETVEYADVYCDMETDGGGWLVWLRRMDGSVDFYREWDDYKDGFGSLDGEFYAGNEVIHRITNNGTQYSLRVDLTNFDGDSIFAKYGTVRLGDESTNYTLFVDGYDSTSTASDELQYCDSQMFSTELYNNGIQEDNMAVAYHAPFWYGDSGRVVLTGIYGKTPPTSVSGIRWKLPWEYREYAKYATMMIRPR